MTIRYVSASAISAVTAHELHRTPDGSSAIDPERTHLNAVLHGPATQQAALDEMLKDGVKGPAAQAEDPYVQMVISASPQFFRTDGMGAGEWDKTRLKAWTDKTMTWLRKKYGDDLAQVSLHLDEDTPHVHVLIIPTYEKAARKPGKPAKGESAHDFAARVKAAEDRPKIRTMGRSSNVLWSQNFARRDMRKSYHKAVENLGLGYGRDFVEEGQPSPKNVPTGKWVREQAAKQADDRAALNADIAALASDRTALAEGQAALAKGQAALAEGQTRLDVGVATLAMGRDMLAKDRAALDADIAALASDRTALEEGQTALAEGRAKLDADAKALAMGQTALAEDRAALDAGVAALASEVDVLASRRSMLDQGWNNLTTEAAAFSEMRNKQLQTAERWAVAIKSGRAEIAHGQAALEADRAALEDEKVHVRGLSAKLSALVGHVEKALQFVKALAPRVRRVTLDAEASANERAAALVARAEIVQAVPPLRKAVSEYTTTLFTRRPSASLAPEKSFDPIEESGPGVDGP